MESTAAPSRACPTPRARSTESTAAPWRAVQLHGRSMESTGAGRGVHFGASGGGVSRNRRRLDGGFCGGRHFRRRRLPKQAALLRRLPQRPAPLDTHQAHGAHGAHGECHPEAHRAHGEAHQLRSREALRKARMRHGVLRGAITGTPWCRSAPGARIHALCMYMPCPCTDRTPGLSPLSGTRPAVDPREHREIPNPPIQNALPATPCKRRSDAKRAPAPPNAP